jgi:hypothetical protein
MIALMMEAAVNVGKRLQDYTTQHSTGQSSSLLPQPDIQNDSIMPSLTVN